MIPSDVLDLLHTENADLVKMLLGVIIMIAVNFGYTYIASMKSDRRVTALKDEILSASVDAAKKYYKSIEEQLVEEQQSKKRVIARLEDSERRVRDLEGKLSTLERQHTEQLLELSKEIRMLSATRDELMERLRVEQKTIEELQQKLVEKDLIIVTLEAKLKENDHGNAIHTVSSGTSDDSSVSGNDAPVREVGSNNEEITKRSEVNGQVGN